MRLLLDTHVYMWVALGSPLLKSKTRAVIDAADEVFVSSASIWEIAIKVRLGKLNADVDALVSAIVESGFTELPVRASHAAPASRRLTPAPHGPVRSPAPGSGDVPTVTVSHRRSNSSPI